MRDLFKDLGVYKLEIQLGKSPKAFQRREKNEKFLEYKVHS